MKALRSLTAACLMLLSPLVVGNAQSPAPPAASDLIVFENQIAQSGIPFKMNNSVTPRKHQVETMISGVAVFDYNNDGLMDIYFVNGAQLPGMEKSDPRFWNRLYRNNGNGTFTDVTEQSGVKGNGFSMGVAAADYDNDGWVDLYVAGVNRNQLFHNNSNGTFTDVTAKAGVGGIHPRLGKLWSIGAGWFDYDNDGLLDLFVVDYVELPPEKEPLCKVGEIVSYCAPDVFKGQPNMLFHNNGDGTFTDVSVRSGIGALIGKGMGVSFADYDGDGYTDIFVSNDTYRNFLFHNERNGTFREVGVESAVAYNENGKSIAGMGSDFRDINNDGLPDIFVVGMVGDTYPLFLNRGAEFEDVTGSWGLRRLTAGSTAWGAGIVDFDNDGWKDIFASCSSILDNSEEIDLMPAKQRNILLRNTGKSSVVDVSKTAGPDFQVPGAHRGVAFGDFNNDGRMDAVVVDQNALPELWINRSAGNNHWLLVKLIGTKSNRDGLGARLKVTLPNGSAEYNHATTSTGLSSSSDPRVHFGLGKSDHIRTLEIWWPSGVHQVLEDPPIDRILTVREAGK